MMFRGRPARFQFSSITMKRKDQLGSPVWSGVALLGQNADRKESGARIQEPAGAGRSATRLGSQTSPRRLKLQTPPPSFYTPGSYVGQAVPRPRDSLAALWVGKQAAPGNVSRCGSFMGRLYPPHRIDAMSKTLRWVNPGSCLLLTDRAAIL